MSIILVEIIILNWILIKINKKKTNDPIERGKNGQKTWQDTRYFTKEEICKSNKNIKVFILISN